MRRESGFSLVELVVAMTVTLIVSSAIYGLLTSGGNAFRREPEVADRQQNIRMAMDLIARDVFGAGAAMPTYGQVFTRNDPAGACAGSLNSCGQTGTMGATAAAARGTGDDEDTDVLELVASDEQCALQSVCSGLPVAGAAGLFVTREGVPQCLRVPGLVLLASDTSFTIQAATATAGAATCTGGARPPNGNLTLTATLLPWVPSPAFASPNPAPGTGNAVYLYRARVTRYRVAPNPDPLDTTPALWRSESGRYSSAGAVVPEPGEGGFNPAGSPWELVARGIEDLQIEYLGGTGGWQNQPPISITNDWNTLVRQVRITLSARATAANLQGQSMAGGGAPNAVRGQLSTTVTPRQAFNELQMGSQIQ